MDMRVDAAAAAGDSRHGTTMRFGGLILTFVDKFNLAWNDQGSGGDNDGAFWNPVPPAGFYMLGSLGVGHYGDVNGQNWALCVKAADDDPDAIRKPERFDWMWGDQGSGADRDGSCWKPVAPAGYVSLGDYFVSGYSPGDPKDCNIACIRADLVGPGVIGPWIWDDYGSGAYNDLSTWQILPEHAYRNTDRILISPNTFAASQSYNQPGGEFKVLNLKVPLVTYPSPEPPQLKDRNRPPDTTDPKLTRVVTVPFTAVADPGLDIHRRVTETPFYDIERWTGYSLVLFEHNDAPNPQHSSRAWEFGVSKEQTDTYSSSTTITVSAEAGFALSGLGAKVSGSVSNELGYSTSTSVSAFRSNSLTVNLDTPAHASGAAWALRDIFVIKRDNGEELSARLTLDDNIGYYIDVYPKTALAKPRRLMRAHAIPPEGAPPGKRG